jgi:hypothetical protein
MITREVLEAQRGQYVKGREQAVANVSVFNGAIEAMDQLLALVTEIEAAQAKVDNDAAIDAAEENTDG